MVFCYSSLSREDINNETINRSNQIFLKPLENYHVDTWSIIQNVCLAASSGSLPALHSRVRGWAEQVLLEVQVAPWLGNISTQEVASLATLGTCARAHLKATEKATREL